ncbi:polyamine ABC transporter ATP-binding protein [Haloferax sp. Atlit-12N]|uniref:ABC transporter ATP-binding protein n=1 Tax=Haloferax sp. Atlit-12N TaxID=2077203 RepID=UPI000E26D962|nr:ABC transporter ATP-binding protein [Haloferax sp. Atlit-12N]RDZ59928.1 polyamine ABC transporter ATP-binding protein [Haloferax sp. Atlit-12N]
MSILTVSNLRKEFGSLVAVDNVNFQVEDGEFVSILGPSGSGKSTILRMVAGFETPTSGEIAIQGTPVNDVPPFNRDVNMVFQGLALFPHLTVAENIGYGLEEDGIPKSERKERISEMLDVVELSGYEDRSIDQLSGGEQQRVALARAIVNEPQIVLFDEPLASLDRKLRQHMQFELQRIQEETGITFLYVTHDQEVAMAVSDRMLVLNDGEMEQLGTVEEIYDAPASKFVADFIGDVNLQPGTVIDSNGTTATIETDQASLKVPNASEQRTGSVSLEPGSEIYLGVRPKRLSVAESADGDRFSVAGTVRNRGYSGEETIYTIETEYGSFTANTADSSYDLGDSVTVAWSPDDVYLFECDEEQQEQRGVSHV